MLPRGPCAAAAGLSVDTARRSSGLGREVAACSLVWDLFVRGTVGGRFEKREGEKKKRKKEREKQKGAFANHLTVFFRDAEMLHWRFEGRVANQKGGAGKVSEAAAKSLASSSTSLPPSPGRTRAGDFMAKVPGPSRVWHREMKPGSLPWGHRDAKQCSFPREARGGGYPDSRTDPQTTRPGEAGCQGCFCRG